MNPTNHITPTTPPKAGSALVGGEISSSCEWVGGHRALTRVLTSVAVILSALAVLQCLSLLGGTPRANASESWGSWGSWGGQPFDVAQARAGMISQAGGHSILVSDSGGNALVVVLDNRTESLMVYRFEGNNSLQLFQKLSLPRLFTEARARGPGVR